MFFAVSLIQTTQVYFRADRPARIVRLKAYYRHFDRFRRLHSSAHNDDFLTFVELSETFFPNNNHSARSETSDDEDNDDDDETKELGFFHLWEHYVYNKAYEFDLLHARITSLGEVVLEDIQRVWNEMAVGSIW